MKLPRKVWSAFKDRLTGAELEAVRLALMGGRTAEAFPVALSYQRESSRRRTRDKNEQVSPAEQVAVREGGRWRFDRGDYVPTH